MLLWFLMVGSYQQICTIWAKCSTCAGLPNIIFDSKCLWSLGLPSGLLYRWINGIHLEVYLIVLPVSLGVSAILNHNIISKWLVAIKIGTEGRRLDVYGYISSNFAFINLRFESGDPRRLSIIHDQATVQIRWVWNIRDRSLHEVVIGPICKLTFSLSHCWMAFIHLINLLQTLFQISFFAHPRARNDPWHVLMQEAIR